MTASIDLTTTEMAAAIAVGTLDPVITVTAAYARIGAREPAVYAWAHLDRERALRDAAVMADEAKAGKLRGPLHGVPVGIKDVFHAEGMPMLANSKTMDPAATYTDSGVAAALRRAGAIILGKCETVEFGPGASDVATRRRSGTSGRR